jgi:hypothetical protein
MTELKNPLQGPYATQPAAEGLAVTPAVNDLVRAQVAALLSSSSSWHELTPKARDEMRGNLEKISAYTAALVQEDFALSERLGQTPVLRSRAVEPLAQAAANPPPPPPPRPAQDEFSTRAADSVARVTRDTLNAIAFPKFVADLLKGTFNAIVDASIQQMEAFGALLANVAKTVDQFMSDNITDNQARDWLAQQYPGHFVVDLKGGGDDHGGRARGGRGARGGRDDHSGPRLRVRKGADQLSKPNLRGDLRLKGDVSLDDDSAESTLVPAARRRLAAQRHEMLSTMVLMGINRIVVTQGRIYARMGFQIDTSDTGEAESASQFDFKHTSAATGWFGFGGAAAVTSVAYVSSTKKNSSDAINVEADLTGEVDLKFKSETFPLERFADMGVISQIQGNTANPAANTPTSPLTSGTTTPAATP